MPNPKWLIPDRLEERRRHGRLKCDSTDCALGELIDLSASGMRVLRKGRSPYKIGSEFKIDLWMDQTKIPVTVRLVHIEKRGFRKRVLGLEFINQSDEQRRRIVELARTAHDQLVMV